MKYSKQCHLYQIFVAMELKGQFGNDQMVELGSLLLKSN